MPRPVPTKVCPLASQEVTVRQGLVVDLRPVGRGHQGRMTPGTGAALDHQRSLQVATRLGPGPGHTVLPERAACSELQSRPGPFRQPPSSTLQPPRSQRPQFNQCFVKKVYTWVFLSSWNQDLRPSLGLRKESEPDVCM